MSNKLTNNDVYAMANQAIINALESGVNPWQKTWKALSTHGMPINLVNKKPYRGMNVFILGSQDVDCQCWLTFKQCRDLKGKVKKGAKSSVVVYWKILEIEDKETEEKKKIYFLRYYRVFNALRDCEGLEKHVAKIEKPNGKEPHASPDKFILEWMDVEGIPLKHGGDSAYYQPKDDFIRMPYESDFDSRNHYIQTLCHECIHATGHEKRLSRNGIVNFDHFGSEQYSFEELIAETGSTYIAVSLGYEPDWNNTAAYLNSWKKKLKANPDWFTKAASKAEKASNYIIGDKVPEIDENDSEAA